MQTVTPSPAWAQPAALSRQNTSLRLVWTQAPELAELADHDSDELGEIIIIIPAA